MAFVNSFAIQGRVSGSSAPLTTSVGQSTPLALERALNGPILGAVLPRRARSSAVANRLVNGLSRTCALMLRRLARSISLRAERLQAHGPEDLPRPHVVPRGHAHRPPAGDEHRHPCSLIWNLRCNDGSYHSPSTRRPPDGPIYSLPGHPRMARPPVTAAGALRTG